MYLNLACSTNGLGAPWVNGNEAGRVSATGLPNCFVSRMFHPVIQHPASSIQQRYTSDRHSCDSCAMCTRWLFYVYAWGGNTWKFWSTCGACGACASS